MTATFYVGDVLDVLGKLPENSVDLVLSSPPFLALRSYLPADHPDKEKEGGSQSTPGEYIDWLIDVVEACDRVLAPHGSLCFELGDTYAGSGGAGGDYNENGLRDGEPVWGGSSMARRISRKGYGGAADRLDGESAKKGPAWPLPKSLSLIPESFRFAMVYGFNPFTGRQTERWRLRNVKTWCRPNPPVGALGDKIRPATSDLMIFCKSPRRFFDLDAVRTGAPRIDNQRTTSTQYQAPGQPARKTRASDESGARLYANVAGAPPLDWIELDYSPDYIVLPPGGYEGAHYAVWPAALLIEPIKSMCPEFVCRTCGEARRRITTNERVLSDGTIATTDFMGGNRLHGVNQKDAVLRGWSHNNRTTEGWTDCEHNDYRPGLVLDPFVGSGTTLAVATGHGRDAWGIDLDARNFDLALERVGPLVLQRGEIAA